MGAAFRLAPGNALSAKMPRSGMYVLKTPQSAAFPLLSLPRMAFGRSAPSKLIDKSIIITSDIISNYPTHHHI
jgi:hypothetical protein